jgi:hypothetical protein
MSQIPNENPATTQLLAQLQVLQTHITQLGDPLCPQVELADLQRQAAEIHEQLRLQAEFGRNQDQWASNNQNPENVQNRNKKVETNNQAPPYQPSTPQDSNPDPTPPNGINTQGRNPGTLTHEIFFTFARILLVMGVEWSVLFFFSFMGFV